jgi:hypothetical protein
MGLEGIVSKRALPVWQVAGLAKVQEIRLRRR